MWGHFPKCIRIISLLFMLRYMRASQLLIPEVSSRQTLLFALGRALDYMAENQQQMDINGYLGVAIAQGQLESMMPLDECTVRNPWRKANYLLKIARNTHYPQNIARLAGGVLEAGRWSGVGKYLNRTLQCKLGAKKFYGRNAKISMKNSPNGRQSDFCLSQLMKQMKGKTSLGEGSSCRISHQCRRILTTGDSREYSLTHRILYSLVSQAMGCNENIPVEEYCCKIMDEVREEQAAGYPVRSRDLFMEQILVCSLSGFGQFLQNKWIQPVLDWQRSSGCWGSTPMQNTSQDPSKNYEKIIKAVLRKRNYRLRAKLRNNSLKGHELLLRFKRSSRSIGPSDCSTHTSGLGVALLAFAARHGQSSQIDKIIYC